PEAEILRRLTVKTRLRLAVVMLFISVVLTTLAIGSRTVAANNKETEHVTFSEPIMVGGTLLKPGMYQLVWEEGSGPQVQVSFEKGFKTIVTAPADLVIEDSKYHEAVQLRTLSDSSKVLERITWKKKALIFAPSS